MAKKLDRIFISYKHSQVTRLRVSGGRDPTGHAAIHAAPTESYLYRDHAWKEAGRAGRRSQGVGRRDPKQQHTRASFRTARSLAATRRFGCSLKMVHLDGT